VVDLDVERLDAQQVGVLPHPRELLERRSAHAAGEDVGERRTL
jgi:hypothetical protein